MGVTSNQNENYPRNGANGARFLHVLDPTVGTSWNLGVAEDWAEADRLRELIEDDKLCGVELDDGSYETVAGFVILDILGARDGFALRLEARRFAHRGGGTMSNG